MFYDTSREDGQASTARSYGPTKDHIKEVKTAHGVLGNFPVYLMPVGGTQEGLELTEKQVAEVALKYGYRFSPRLHVHLFGNAWGT